MENIEYLVRVCFGFILQLKFDVVQAYENKPECEKIVKDVEKISYNDTCICQDTMGKECFNTYQTDFVPVKVKIAY